MHLESWKSKVWQLLQTRNYICRHSVEAVIIFGLKAFILSFVLLVYQCIEYECEVLFLY